MSDSEFSQEWAEARFTVAGGDEIEVSWGVIGGPLLGCAFRIKTRAKSKRGRRAALDRVLKAALGRAERYVRENVGQRS